MQNLDYFNFESHIIIFVRDIELGLETQAVGFGMVLDVNRFGSW